MEHEAHLGGLIGNFQSLELLIRAYLQRLPSAKAIGVAHGTDIWKLPVGQSYPKARLVITIHWEA